MHNKAAYKFTMENETVTFELIGEDNCAQRFAYLTYSDWTEQE